MTMILRFFAAALLVVLFAVVFGVTLANSPIIGGAAQSTPQLSQISPESQRAIALNKDYFCDSWKEYSLGSGEKVKFSKKGEFPLHCAAWEGQASRALTLIKAGRSVMVVNRFGATPLDVAIIKHGKYSVIALVLQGAMEKEASKNRREAEELLRELE